MNGVFKFQASQMPHHEQYLVYPEDRYFMVQKNMTDEMEKLFKKYGEKFYAEADFDIPASTFTIKKILAEKLKW